MNARCNPRSGVPGYRRAFSLTEASCTNSRPQSRHAVPLGDDGSGWARVKGVTHRSTSNSAAGSTPKAANDNLAGESLAERGLRGER